MFNMSYYSFASLWFSGVGSGAALVIAQYTAFKIQHEHALTLPQRYKDLAVINDTL